MSNLARPVGERSTVDPVIRPLMQEVGRARESIALVLAHILYGVPAFRIAPAIPPPSHMCFVSIARSMTGGNPSTMPSLVRSVSAPAPSMASSVPTSRCAVMPITVD